MTVILCCQSKMTAALGSIPGLLHGAESKTADLRFILQPLDLLQDLLDLLGRDLLAHLLYSHSLITQKGQQTFHLFRIRIIVGPVNKWLSFFTIFFCHSLISHQHKVFNDPGGNISLIRLYINSPSCCIQDDLAFRKIKINGTSVMSAFTDDC